MLKKVRKALKREFRLMMVSDISDDCLEMENTNSYSLWRNINKRDIQSIWLAEATISFQKELILFPWKLESWPTDHLPAGCLGILELWSEQKCLRVTQITGRDRDCLRDYMFSSESTQSTSGSRSPSSQLPRALLAVCLPDDKWFICSWLSVLVSR